MAFFFKIAKTPTGGYEEFTKLLSQIDRKGESINVTNPLPLREYITKHLGDYYSYTGSLTTPPCSEEVTWLDFKFPIDITEDQLNAFRSLTAHDDHLKNNFRPIQPLNDRLVYMNTYREPLFVDAANSAGRMVPPFLSVLRLLF
ncbi:hypothetical protein KR009_009752 [Drosophila setifemur]|nr:hypothetical protein KR009_009752 [Drosophila setifemur]